MMWLHPLLQTTALLFSVYVLYLGLVRFKALHRGVKGQLFQWKRHVLWGSLVMLAWTAGMSLGLVMAKTSWNAVLLTGAHWVVGLLMLPLALFGYVSGRVMDQRKARRIGLPLAHGINNAVLVLLAACQLLTGIGIIRDFMIP
jgi:hypothetical protein